MMLPAEECFKTWRPSMLHYLGRDRTEEAIEKMRPIIDRAVESEKAGKIRNMCPTTVTPNSKESLERGEYYLEIRYQDVASGEWNRWVKQILKPEESDDAGTAQTEKRQAVESRV